MSGSGAPTNEQIAMLEVLKTNMSTIITTFQDLVKSTRIGNADASDDEDGDEAGDIEIEETHLVQIDTKQKKLEAGANIEKMANAVESLLNLISRLRKAYSVRVPQRTTRNIDEMGKRLRKQTKINQAEMAKLAEEVSTSLKRLEEAHLNPSSSSDRGSPLESKK